MRTPEIDKALDEYTRAQKQYWDCETKLKLANAASTAAMAQMKTAMEIMNTAKRKLDAAIEHSVKGRKAWYEMP